MKKLDGVHHPRRRRRRRLINKKQQTVAYRTCHTVCLRAITMEATQQRCPSMLPENLSLYMCNGAQF